MSSSSRNHNEDDSVHCTELCHHINLFCRPPLKVHQRWAIMDEHALNELLECSVCLERLDCTSKVLPCQHTFCRRCLEEIVSTKSELRCPECRTLVQVSVEDLPGNILLIRLLEGIKNAARLGSGTGASPSGSRAGSCPVSPCRSPGTSASSPSHKVGFSNQLHIYMCRIGKGMHIFKVIKMVRLCNYMYHFLSTGLNLQHVKKCFQDFVQQESNFVVSGMLVSI